MAELSKVPIVCKYPDVFPEELPGMPPDREIEFLIELLPGIAPISKRPYRMPPNNLEEIKKQIKELLEKRIYSPKFVTLGSPSSFGREEGWNSENGCGLSFVE